MSSAADATSTPIAIAGPRLECRRAPLRETAIDPRQSTVERVRAADLHGASFAAGLPAGFNFRTPAGLDGRRRDRAAAGSTFGGICVAALAESPALAAQGLGDGRGMAPDAVDGRAPARRPQRRPSARSICAPARFSASSGGSRPSSAACTFSEMAREICG